MTKKLIAVGNVLMKDDGIAIAVARLLEKDLTQLGIQVYYAETDIGYCMDIIETGDYLIILDAADCDKQPGEISVFSWNDYRSGYIRGTPHEINIADLLQLYAIDVDGIILAIEMKEISFGYGLSPELNEKLEMISKNLVVMIKNLQSQWGS